MVIRSEDMSLHIQRWLRYAKRDKRIINTPGEQRHSVRDFVNTDLEATGASVQASVSGETILEFPKLLPGVLSAIAGSFKDSRRKAAGLLCLPCWYSSH
ncbi:hypothetical protein GRJ2_001578600 [Grus japonensis]|uniref:Uncharacterized protein n=1 Tax=Grus japonensis TaxID=30415 RepID=A0ABC9X0B8_GRUJA